MQVIVGIWNPDKSGFQMVKKEIGLQVIRILNGTWNPEARPMEIQTNGRNLVKKQKVISDTTRRVPYNRLTFYPNRELLKY